MKTKQATKLIVTFTLAAMLRAAQAGDLTINGNLTVTNNSIVNGQVGIGTPNPSAKLDVRPIPYANNQSGGVQLATTDGHYPSGMFLRTDSPAIPRLAFDISSAELLSLNNSSGNVGIGTTYPTGGRLDVETSGSKIGVYGALSADNLGNVSAAAVKGIYTGNGTFGALGFVYTNSGYASYGVYGHATSGYAGYFEGTVSVSGDLSISSTMYGNSATFTHLGIGTSAYTAVPLMIEEPQAYVNLLSDSSANGSVIQLINNYTSSPPTYLGAINFIDSSGNPVGQIGYQSRSDEINFRVGGADRAILSSAGLSVNGSICCTSDRNAKERFSPIDAQDILKRVASLPISNWYYKQDPATRHIGPVAQDFYAAFNVGPDDKHIATVDEEGVALAAIQGLNQKMDTESAEFQAEVTELRKRLGDIETRFEKFQGAIAR